MNTKPSDTGGTGYSYWCTISTSDIKPPTSNLLPAVRQALFSFLLSHFREPLKNSIVGTKISQFERTDTKGVLAIKHFETAKYHIQRPTKAYQEKTCLAGRQVRREGLSLLEPNCEICSHEGVFQRFLSFLPHSLIFALRFSSFEVSSRKRWINLSRIRELFQ